MKQTQPQSWITLTGSTRHNNKPITLDRHSIIAFHPFENSSTQIILPGPTFIHVQQSYEEIKALLSITTTVPPAPKPTKPTVSEPTPTPDNDNE